MEPYDILSTYYDELMDDVPYGTWAKRILSILAQSGIRSGHLLEYAAGTGSMTELLLEGGFRLTAVERSEGMIEQAQHRLSEQMSRVRLIQGDMLEFKSRELYESAVCVCDGINYLTEDGALYELLQGLKPMIRPGGVFIFDLSTEWKFKHSLDGRTIAENNDDYAFIWENHYDSSEKILEFDLAVFERSGSQFVRTEEHHTQRAYDSKEIHEICDELGLDLSGPWHEYTNEPAREDSERVHYIITFGGNQ